jgi:hypothetical protein
MDSYEISLWEYTLVERLIDSDYASIELIILNDGKREKRAFFTKLKRNWKRILFILYRKLDQKLFKVKPDAFELRDTADLLKETAVIKTKPIATEFSDRFQDEDIEKIKDHNLDILIRLGFRILRGEILKSARFGVWSYHHGDNNVNRGGPAGCWEVLENWDVTGSILQILNEDLDAGRVLYRSFSQTDKRSMHRNRNKYFWKSVSFLPRKVEELYNVGEVEFFNKVEEQNKYPSFYSNRLFTSKNLDNWKTLKLITAHLLRFIKDRFIRFIYLDQWILLFSLRNGLSSSFWRFKKIVPPKDRFYADPFIIQKGNKYYIFIEEFIYESNKGHISVIRIDEKGSFQKPVKIIDKTYHLSYPFIFEYKDDYYLIPESSSNKTIELYKCVEFPFKWEFQMNLMENIEAFDSTLFYHRDKWWLFANIIENPGASSIDELFLYSSEELLSNTWTPHPLNPIVSDVRKSRPAGCIFIHKGKIIRPSQNSSKRYGYGMKINEIRTLSDTEYEEFEIESIEPDWDNKIKATHTINNAGNLTVIDGILRRNRFF